MDPKFLEELQKLKEQKDADLDKIQDLAQLSIPDFEDVEIPEDDFAAESEEASGGTIKFQRVTNPDPEKTPVSGGRRGRKPVKPEIDEETKKKRAKIRKIVLISVSSALATVAVILAVFFGVRHANKTNYTYPYWGMGISIENGVNSYTFFGNLDSITQYGAIGQIEAQAEFKKGNCVKETAYTAEGDVDYYYAHEYDDDLRIMSSYHEDGQMIKSVKYTPLQDGTVQAETTYYLEEGRVETAILTLSDDGNILFAQHYNAEVLTHQQTYSGTLVTEEVHYDELKNVTTRIIYEYNGAKQLLTQTEYDAQNNIQSRTVNQYNEKNLLTKTIRYNGQGDILDYDTYNYDLNNNPIKQVNYSGDGTMQNQILKVFNDKNRVTKETSLKADGSIVYCYGYDYDEKGYIAKSIVYNTENSTVIEQYTLYTRNQAGTIIETNTHNSGNILTEKSIYNDAGFLTELYKFTDSGVLTLEQKSKYDEKQRLTQKTVTNFSDEGEKTSHFSEQYNEQGLVTIRINEDVEEGLYEQYLYQYHETGWKTQETLFDNAGKTVYDRTFDEQERIASETLYENGRETTYNEYTYNEQNLISLRKSLDTLTNILTKTSYTYNDQGVMVSSLDTDITDQNIVKKEYDENGLVIVQTNYTDDGEVEDYFRFEYDDQDRVIVQETYQESGLVTEKIVYYYRTDGGYDYTVYDESGIAIEDSRGPEYLPSVEEQPDTPPAEGYDTSGDDGILPDFTTTDTSSDEQQDTETSESEPENTRTENSDTQTETSSQSASDSNTQTTDSATQSQTNSETVTDNPTDSQSNTQQGSATDTQNDTQQSSETDSQINSISTGNSDSSSVNE